MTAPSRGRRRPEPAIPVGGADPRLAPPGSQPFYDQGDLAQPAASVGYDPNILASTDPSEVPPPPLPPPGTDEDYPTEPVEEESPELSPEEEIMFASLLTCGRRSKVIRLMDHTVVVQTLCGDDDLRIGLYVRDFKDTIGEQRAYQIGVAAAGIRTIDGQPLVQSLFENAGEDALFDQKLMKVAQMYPTIINRIYRAVLDAEREFVELATKLGKLDG